MKKEEIELIVDIVNEIRELKKQLSNLLTAIKIFEEDNQKFTQKEICTLIYNEVDKIISIYMGMLLSETDLQTIYHRIPYYTKRKMGNFGENLINRVDKDFIGLYWFTKRNLVINSKEKDQHYLSNLKEYINLIIKDSDNLEKYFLQMHEKLFELKKVD